VHVVRLHGKVHDAKRRARSFAEGPPHLQKDCLLAQTGEPFRSAQRDMNGMAFLMVGPRRVRDAWT
jgi:hypothetical protein